MPLPLLHRRKIISADLSFSGHVLSFVEDTLSPLSPDRVFVFDRNLSNHHISVLDTSELDGQVIAKTKMSADGCILAFYTHAPAHKGGGQQQLSVFYHDSQKQKLVKIQVPDDIAYGDSHSDIHLSISGDIQGDYLLLYQNLSVGEELYRVTPHDLKMTKVSDFPTAKSLFANGISVDGRTVLMGSWIYHYDPATSQLFPWRDLVPALEHTCGVFRNQVLSGDGHHVFAGSCEGSVDLQF